MARENKCRMTKISIWLINKHIKEMLLWISMNFCCYFDALHLENDRRIFGVVKIQHNSWNIGKCILYPSLRIFAFRILHFPGLNFVRLTFKIQFFNPLTGYFGLVQNRLLTHCSRPKDKSWILKVKTMNSIQKNWSVQKAKIDELTGIKNIFPIFIFVQQEVRSV